MNAIILAVVLAAGTVTIDQPPPSLDAGRLRNVAETTDAGVSFKFQTKAERRDLIKRRVDAIVKEINLDDPKEKWVLDKLMFATQNVGSDQDAVLVVLRYGKLTRALMYVYANGDWKMFPDIFT